MGERLKHYNGKLTLRMQGVKDEPISPVNFVRTQRHPNIDEANELGIGGFEIVVSDELERIALEQGEQATNTFHNIVYGNNVVTNAHFDEYKATLKVIPHPFHKETRI